MLSVYVTRALPNHLLSKFAKNGINYKIWDSPSPVPRAELLRNIEGIDGLLCTLSDKIDDAVLLKARNLKVVSTLSVGYNHISIEELKRRNIRLGYTPDVLTDATAELTVSLVLSVARRILEASNAVLKGEWNSWSPFWMCGKGLNGSSIGFYGLGRIGKAVALRLSTFGPAKIMYTSSKGREGVSVPLASITGCPPICADPVDFETLLESSDFVITCCALNDQTRLKFNDQVFNKMKPGAIFINTSRGEVVDQDALLRALTRPGGLGGAGLDVTTPEPLPTDSPLLALSNCLVLPHIGSATKETRIAMVDLSIENLISGLSDPPQKMPTELKL